MKQDPDGKNIDPFKTVSESQRYSNVNLSDLDQMVENDQLNLGI